MPSPARRADPSPRHLEERSLNAWPGAQQALYDGWLVRFSEGYTKRANCAVPFYPGSLEPAGKVSWCEEAYGRRGLPAIFKILPFAEPRDLDDLLARRGYERCDLTLVMCRDLAVPLTVAPACGSAVETGVDGAYLEEYARLNRIPAACVGNFADILGRTPGEVGYASIRRRGHLVACGLGILEGAHLGLYGIATCPDWRRRGLGRALVQSLLHWGVRAGGRCAYLQARLGNEAALALYEAEGFGPSYEYWYRVQASA